MISEESQAALHLFFIRVGRYMGRGIQELGLSPGEARVLRTISIQGDESGMNPSVISEALGVRQPTLTPIFNSLEEKGYIVRVRDKNDRRKVFISLTDKCRGDLNKGINSNKSFAKSRRLLERLEECLTPEEINQLVVIMKKIDNFVHQEKHKHGEGCYRHAHHHTEP